MKVLDNIVPWERLSGCSILVTGASGLIGSSLVSSLMDNPKIDYQVYALSRNEDKALKHFQRYANNDSFHIMSGDVSQPIEGSCCFDYIIHAASNGSPNFFVSQPVEVMKSNLYGVSNLIEYGLSHGMKRFLFVSSGEVYGQTEKEMIDEKDYGYVDILNTRSCYPSSKRAAETLAISYAAEYGVDVVIARPCHIYGPQFTDLDNRVYAQFLRNALNDEDIVLKSAGDQCRSWCYVDDCVTALLLILLEGKRGEAYNIADRNSVLTIRELAEMIARISGCRVAMQEPSTKELDGFNPVRRSVYDTAKLEALGWSVEGTMESKVSKTVENLKSTL